MLNAKKRILVIGQGDQSTGFARVLTSILPFLVPKFSIHHFAINYSGEQKQISEDYIVYPNKLEGDVHGQAQLGALLQLVKPDLVWIVQDPWYFPILEEAITEYPHPLKVVVYAAVDNAALDPQYFRGIGFIDEYIVFTHFARNHCERMIRQASLPMSSFKVIPHGVNAHTFYPIASGREEARKLAREQLFADRPELKDTFIVLNANRNQYRKRIDTTIEGFALFAANKPDARLYLHMGLTKIGYNIPELVAQAGIEDKIIYTGDNAFHPVVSDEQLNLIYNACDVGLNTASAEGWGLVSFEHAAAGVAQVVSNHTAFAEIWKDAALMMTPLPEAEGEFASSYNLAPEEVANALESLYADRELLQHTAHVCYIRATHKDYNWQQISSQFEQVFTSLLADARQ
jgi:D-inositol-3-phosphate glycosyltransferase